MIDLLVVLIAGTSLWVLIDARSIGVKKGQISGFFNMGPAGWFFSCLLLWIVGFPAYLAKRDEYKRARRRPAEQPNALDALDQLGRLKAQGVISEAEFVAKKQELLSRV